jgi:hypothetical protein
LRETAEQGRYPDTDRFNRSLTRVYKKRLLLAQEIYTEERLIKVTGRGNKVKIVKFKASDLRGNTDVRLELDSGLITTKSGQAQMMLNMIQAGFFQEGDNAVSPTIRQEVLERMGMTSFTDETNNDEERAESEGIAAKTGGEALMVARPGQSGEMEVIEDDPLFKYDNHAIHYETHRKTIISQEFKEWDTQAQARFIWHTETHKQQIDSVPPDLRQYVQIDKLLPLLTQSERAQALEKLGIQPGNEPMTGLPDANTVTKSRTKLMDGQVKEEGKDAQRQADMTKHLITEQGKQDAAKQRGREKGE